MSPLTALDKRMADFGRVRAVNFALRAATVAEPQWRLSHALALLSGNRE